MGAGAAPGTVIVLPTKKKGTSTATLTELQKEDKNLEIRQMTLEMQISKAEDPATRKGKDALALETMDALKIQRQRKLQSVIAQRAKLKKRMEARPAEEHEQFKKMGRGP